jgi:hypothetical protein
MHSIEDTLLYQTHYKSKNEKNWPFRVEAGLKYGFYVEKISLSGTLSDASHD